jgi:cytoskeletal protein CcmA (bactofilin family)
MFGRSNSGSHNKTPVASMRKGTSPSVISADMHVLGNIVSSGLLDIDGQIDGNVKCQIATVRSNGRVRGDIQAEAIHIYGVVEGLVKARSVSLYSTAKVQGTIMHESLSIEDGAFVDGKFKRTDNVFVEDDTAHARLPHYDASFDNDNPEPSSPEEMKMLENLRLIS